MGALPLPRILFLGLLGVLLATSFTTAAPQAARSAAVVGTSECLDCAEKNIKADLAFKGLGVAIKCKAINGKYETKGVGKLDKNGGFSVQLASELLQEDGELKDECFAQLRSASNAPCPDKNGLSPSKLFLKTKKDGLHTFGAATKLSFASATCASAFFWPHHKYPSFPKWKKSLPKWKKSLPKFPLPPFTFPHKHYFPPKPSVPIYKPPVPVYKPPTPVYKPPVPVYKPPTPVYKPPVPVYKPPPIPKKPCPPIPFKKPPVPVYKPPVPIYKPPVPVYKKPPVPVVKKPLPPPVPVYKKPLPPPVPVYKKPLPPPVPYYKPPIIYKKPFPPIYKKPFPPIYKKPFPPIPQLPPKYSHPHPKFGFPPKHG